MQVEGAQRGPAVSNELLQPSQLDFSLCETVVCSFWKPLEVRVVVDVQQCYRKGNETKTLQWVFSTRKLRGSWYFGTVSMCATTL